MLKIDQDIVDLSIWDNFWTPFLFFLSSSVLGLIMIYLFDPFSDSQGAYLGGFAGGLYAFLFGVYASKLQRNVELVKRHTDELIQLERRAILVVNGVNSAKLSIKAIVDALKPNLTSPELHIYTSFNRIPNLIDLEFVKSDLQDLVLLNMKAMFALEITSKNDSIDSLNQVNQELRSFGLSKPEHASVYKNNIKKHTETLEEFSRSLEKLKTQAIALQAYSRRMAAEIPTDWFTRHVVRYTAYSLDEETLKEHIEIVTKEYNH